MARAGLGAGWDCLFANDLSPKKAASYRANFGDNDFWLGDVNEAAPHLPHCRADLAWGSFPCQDLSLAGAGAGLDGARSGAFYGFMSAMHVLRETGRAPRVLVLENVCGALTSRGGRDFAAIGKALSEAGYRFGALVVDAALFLPQSRPRLFIVAVDRDAAIPAPLLSREPVAPWSPKALVVAHAGLDEATKPDWIWWRLDAPRANVPRLAAILEDAPRDVAWRSAAETQALLDQMAPLHRARIDAILAAGERRVGAVYRRIRPDGAGGKTQRAEARFDGLAGCLRTPAGGSSRQFLLEIDRGEIRTRLLSGREAARLMGLADDYVLPARYNDAYKLAGDGVAVPVVRWLAAELIERLVGLESDDRLAV